MAVTIDATVGGEDSNSYVTLAESETYFEYRPFSTDWLALTDDEKSQYLIYATLLIDNMLLPYGTIASDTQKLNFPREDLYDCNGRELDSDIIPDEIKYSQMEQAIYLYTSGDITSEPSILSKGIKSAKVGDLSVTLDSLNVANKLSDQTINFLRCYGVITAGATANISMVQTYRN
jgi:hypothetical protein